MSQEESRGLQAKEKAEVTGPTEQTRAGLVFTPEVDIFETEKDITLLADMPGVKADQLTIDLRDNILTLDGEVKSPEADNEVDIFREYRTGKYYRQFNLSELIDQSKIDAELKDGVLRLTLPKAEETKPRKIEVKAS
ncbi:Hsp20/alpha crystallin family protein [uncultured Desulfobacterium sp.]|uniref:Hsp20/alpha crystallin family protein n=1 Tax=uncultured Desulfobacterium sp. TaxID=201089 RepID=A0A445MVD4_9BACT|nr:Hsp20/alpha crystallin family protein [uncultured Desulfobacterium sp.]